MRIRESTRNVAMALALLGAGLPCLAQDDQRRGNGGYMALLDNIDLLVGNYAKLLGRKYDLNDEQHAYTEQLLQEKVQVFFGQHEENLRELLDTMFDVRTGGEMDQRELVDWGKRVLPIYNDAKRVILEGNTDWREILTAEQQAIHDKDLRQMHTSFSDTDEQLGRIVSGKMTVEEFRKPRRATRRRSTPRTANRPAQAKPQGQPPAINGGGNSGPGPANFGPGGGKRLAQSDKPATPPAQPRGNVTRTAGGRSTTTTRGNAPRPEDIRKRTTTRAERNRNRSRGATKASAGGANYESKWDAYVRQFIEKYKLNDDQAQKANTILKDCKQKAARYVAANKVQFEKTQTGAREAARSKNQTNRANAAKKRAKLLEPINKIFETQLKPRLDKLPTRAQRRAAGTSSKRGGTKKQPSKKGGSP